MTPTLRPALLAAVLALPATATAQPSALATHAERSGFTQTGRYDEVTRLCGAFAAHYPERVRCEQFGTTPEGRPMHLLVATDTGAFTAVEAAARGIPVTLMQGGIHAGEIDGKDAGFLALRQILDGEAAPGALERQVLLFVPVFNVDGHERFGAWNRPNQRGPEQMGWRTTAQNYNLNRDYLKADAPEMRAMLGLVGAWDPLVYVDLHATNGAQFEHDIAIQVEPLHGGDEVLRVIGTQLRDATIARLAADGALPLPFYPSFVEHDNPASGIEDGAAPPRFSQGYMQVRNRFGMLVETHSWKDYSTRVALTRNTIVAVAELVAQHGSQWLDATRAADVRAAALAGQPVPLDYKATDKARTMQFRGYAYTRTPSDVSGALVTRYDETTPQAWTIPVRDEVVPGRVVKAPGAGYLVPAAHADWVSRRLDVHGVQYRSLDKAPGEVAAQAFRAEKTEFAPRPMESHQRLTVEGTWAAETHDVAAGALFVPIAQPLSRLVMALLEPQAPDSLAAWGLFNNHFERKEYMEPYVAEAVAREMLAADPALKATFERRLREDAAFAKDPSARLDFFYRRHSAWDDRFNLYPVLRVDTAPR
ncbi:M14 family metallopeptidase [Lysobacter sp. A3-1-A15]|uniref:M14 family metallopeptidase n=1 Tax=Novilysobacter viscosus TaxID=3098602 RepID=UPI002EDA4A13